METKWIEIDENNIEKEAVQEAGCIIKNGGLVAFPTETVYGLAIIFDDKSSFIIRLALSRLFIIACLSAFTLTELVAPNITSYFKNSPSSNLEYTWNFPKSKRAQRTIRKRKK